LKNALQDLIEYESENTGLEFKAVQYSKAMHEEFLRDVIAMANAKWQGQRLLRELSKYVSSDSNRADLTRALVEEMRSHLGASTR
jgi:hypothetical protein